MKICGSHIHSSLTVRNPERGDTLPFYSLTIELIIETMILIGNRGPYPIRIFKTALDTSPFLDINLIHIINIF